MAGWLLGRDINQSSMSPLTEPITAPNEAQPTKFAYEVADSEEQSEVDVQARDPPNGPARNAGRDPSTGFREMLPEKEPLGRARRSAQSRSRSHDLAAVAQSQVKATIQLTPVACLPHPQRPYPRSLPTPTKLHGRCAFAKRATMLAATEEARENPGCSPRLTTTPCPIQVCAHSPWAATSVSSPMSSARPKPGSMPGGTSILEQCCPS